MTIRRFFTFLVTGMFLMAMSACTTPHAENNADFSLRGWHIKDHVTSKAELVQEVGLPTYRYHTKDGGETWIYTRIHLPNQRAHIHLEVHLSARGVVTSHQLMHTFA